MSSTTLMARIETIKDTKVKLKSLACRVPYNKSEIKNKKTASAKYEKNIIPASPNNTDIQKGQNKMEMSKRTEKQILFKTIFLYYLEEGSEASVVDYC
ncbi:MAG: hypothetical protein ACREGC_02395 [Minisyncoccia bacterium]